MIAFKNTPLPRLFFRIFLFSLFSNCLSLTVAARYVSCITSTDYTRPAIADCYTAIKLIPDGTLEFSGQVPGLNKPIEFRLPDDHQKRKVFFPAEFRHGSCGIYVQTPYINGPHGRKISRVTRLRLVSELYFNLYPDLKVRAEKVIAQCFDNDDMRGKRGTTVVHSVIRAGGLHHAFLGQAPLQEWNVVASLGVEGVQPTAERLSRLTYHLYEFNAQGKIVHLPPQRNA